MLIRIDCAGHHCALAVALVKMNQKIVLHLSKYGIGGLPGIPASIGNIWEDGLGRIPASIEIWVLAARIFRGTQQLFTPPRNFEVNKCSRTDFRAILSDFE